MGSSPRMRGALMTSLINKNAAGIIPADAGSTSEWRITACATWDHPRGCGEHALQGRPGLEGRGSSPRMRGALGEPHGRRLARRIIPADAGSTTNADRIATYD